MDCVSITHRQAPVEIRERAAFDREAKLAFYQAAKAAGIRECVLLCTCNRTEIFFTGNKDADLDFMEKQLSDHSGISPEEMMPYFRIYQEKSALHHLFKVAAGIDSMLMGEDEILGQVKDAFLMAQEGGHTGYELNTVFKSAITWAKKIKTETELSRTPVSVATLVANEVFHLPLPEKKVMIIGASGKMGLSILKNIGCKKNIRIFSTVRHHNAVLSQTAGKLDVTLIPYEDRYDYMDDMDVIISATSSPHYTVTKHQLLPVLKQKKNRYFLDISVPADIDRGVKEIPGTVLLDIDGFRILAEENNMIKKQAACSAEKMIDSGLDELERELLFHGFLPEIPEVKSMMEELPFERLLYKARDEMSAEALESFFKVLHQMKEERK